jgi:glutamyl/glutaminyl-tRNA synthetase
LFRLEDVNLSPAFFDIKKLAAFNGEYIRMMPIDEFVAECDRWVPADSWDRDRLAIDRHTHPAATCHVLRPTRASSTSSSARW